MRALLALLLVAGCSTYGQRVAATCASLGAPQGSPHYWSCVQQQVDVDRRDRAMWGGTTAAGAAVLQGPQRVYVVGQ